MQRLPPSPYRSPEKKEQLGDRSRDVSGASPHVLVLVVIWLLGAVRAGGGLLRGDDGTETTLATVFTVLLSALALTSRARPRRASSLEP